MEINEEYKIYIKDFVRALPATLFFKDTEGRYVFSTKVSEMLNTGSEGTIIGKSDIEVQSDKALGQRYYEEDMQILKTGKPTHSIDFFQTPDGGEIYLEILKDAIRNDEGEIIGICGICNDVTEIEKLRRQYEKLSLYDPLTGAYNRNYSAEHDFDNAESLPCSYIFCDCNNLKSINDSFGHDMGDRYIIEAYRILEKSMKDNSIIVRWGGDEFLMITPNCDSAAHEELLAEIAFSQSKLSEIKPGMGLSVGGVMRKTLEMTESLVMKQADQKMYENKKVQGKRFVIKVK